MEKDVVKQLNTNVNADLIGRIERYIYENKSKGTITKTAVVTQSIEKFLKSKGY